MSMMSAADQDLARRVREVLARALEMPAGSIPADAAQGCLEKWDSLGHLNVVMELEAEFGVSLSTEEAIGLRSIPEIVTSLQRHLHGD